MRLIGVQLRALLDFLQDRSLQDVALHVRNYGSANLTLLPVKDSEYSGLIGVTTGISW
jgi:hypothetical protein